MFRARTSPYRISDESSPPPRRPVKKEAAPRHAGPSENTNRRCSGALCVLIDRYGAPDATPKSVLGGLATVLAALLFATYCAYRVVDHLEAPSDVVPTARWTIVDGPLLPGPLYPMLVECLAPGGCDVGLRYAAETAFSASCVAASALHSATSALIAGRRARLATGDTCVALECYSDDPRDGFFAFHNGSGAFGVAIESVAPIAGVVTRVRVPLHAGRTLLTLVNTTDLTYPPARSAATAPNGTRRSSRRRRPTRRTTTPRRPSSTRSGRTSRSATARGWSSSATSAARGRSASRSSPCSTTASASAGARRPPSRSRPPSSSCPPS